ncbi:UNVERIFIED_CONTAM: hypothetical protein Slati_2425800, partial [Sesamum latifolium]
LCLGQATPAILPEGSSPEERLTFEKWHEDNRKVRSIILASMTNEIQKQYDRLEDVPSIMLRMKDVYAVPDRHIRYAATKAFFGQDDRRIERLRPPRRKARVPDAGRGRRARRSQPLLAPEVLLLLPEGKGQREGGVLSGRRQMMCACIAKEKGHWKRECPQLLSNPGMFVVEVNMISNSASWVLDTGCGAHICNDLQVLERSRRLSKDEMILRLGDGKAVAAEAVGSLRLVVSNHIRIDLKDCYFVPSTSLRPLEGSRNTDLKLRTKLTAKIKALRSDRGGEYLSGEFIDYLKENGILSQWTPPGTPQLNGVAERRNRTLLDMVRSMMSFTELPPSFWATHLRRRLSCLNIAPSKSVPRTPYEIWHGKPASYKYLRVWGSPAYVKRLVEDKLDSRSSLCRFIGYPKETAGYYFYDSAEQNFCLEERSILGKGFSIG